MDDTDVPGMLPAAMEVVDVARRAVSALKRNHEWSLATELQATLDTYDTSVARAQSTARQIQAQRDREAGRFK